MKPWIDLGFVQIPTFYFVISISLTVLVVWLSKRVEDFRADRKIAFNLALMMMFAGFLGSRVLHVIYEEPQYYAAFPLEIFKFWKGGFVFYGGFMAGFAACLIYLEKIRQDYRPWADFFTPLLAAAYAMGRVGCFFEGCCYGIACEWPWAVHGKHPTQLYMSFVEFVILAYVLFREKKINFKPGALFWTWLMLHTVSRFSIEFLRDDPRGLALNMGAFNLSVSQVISVILFITAGYFKNRRTKS